MMVREKSKEEGGDFPSRDCSRKLVEGGIEMHSLSMYSRPLPLASSVPPHLLDGLHSFMLIANA